MHAAKCGVGGRLKAPGCATGGFRDAGEGFCGSEKKPLEAVLRPPGQKMAPQDSIWGVLFGREG